MALPTPTSGEPQSTLAPEIAALIDAKNPGQAAVLVEAMLAKLAGRRARFQLKTHFALALTRGGFAAQAMPILLVLEAEVEEFQLERWEPALAVMVLQGLLLATAQLERDSERLRSLQLRLAALDSLVVLMVRS